MNANSSLNYRNTNIYQLNLCAVNKAFQYSSITSVTLLDCWTIPWAILFTWFFLGTRYSLWQLGGGALCVLGLCLVILSDTWVGGGGDFYDINSSSLELFDFWMIILIILSFRITVFQSKSKFSGGSIPILGDVLVIGGTVFYAISNVGEVCQLQNSILIIT